jgi:hypothetical protein|tara:strand:- start:423 stop:566 length:144 start_codon:yes stop_codon:yes gene_type:complete
MFKFLIGIAVGILISTYYPDISPILKYKFLEQGGVRDTVVDTLKEIK